MERISQKVEAMMELIDETGGNEESQRSQGHILIFAYKRRKL